MCNHMRILPECCIDTSQTVCGSTFSPTPPLCTVLHYTIGTSSNRFRRAPPSAPGVLSFSIFSIFFFATPVWSRMSRQLSQLPTPDLPAGASPQFGSCTQPAGSLTGGHHNSMSGLKSLLQHPMKGDHRLKLPSDMKGENLGHVIVVVQHLCTCLEKPWINHSAWRAFIIASNIMMPQNSRLGCFIFHSSVMGFHVPLFGKCLLGL